MQHLLTVAVIAAVGLPSLLLPTILQSVISGAFSASDSRMLWLSGGLVAGVLTCLGIRGSSRLRLLTTLQHELSHLAMALALGTSPRSISAGEDAGLFQYALGGPVPKVRAFFITLAPYWISPLLLVPIVLALLIPSLLGWRMGIWAWLAAICLTLPLAEIHPRQPDLRRYGVVLPILAAGWMWAGVVSAVLTLALPEPSSLLGLYRDSWRVAARVF